MYLSLKLYRYGKKNWHIKVSEKMPPKQTISYQLVFFSKIYWIKQIWLKHIFLILSPSLLPKRNVVKKFVFSPLVDWHMILSLGHKLNKPCRVGIGAYLHIKNLYKIRKWRTIFSHIKQDCLLSINSFYSRVFTTASHT